MKKPTQLIHLEKSYHWLAAPIILLLLWELTSRLGWWDVNFFPAPVDILERLFSNLFNSSEFLGHVGASLWRLFLGSVLAIPLAIGLAIGVEFHKGLAFLFKPLIALFYPMPKLAIFPLLILILGTGHLAQVGIIFIGVFFLVFIDANQGVRRLIENGYLEVVDVFQLSLTDKYFHVVFRGSLSEILNGVRLGLGYGLVMVVAGEFAFSKKGLGFFIWNAWDQFRIIDLYCGLFMFGFLGLSLFFLLEKIRKSIP